MERDDYNFLEDIPKYSLMSTKCHSKYANRKNILNFIMQIF